MNMWLGYIRTIIAPMAMAVALASCTGDVEPTAPLYPEIPSHLARVPVPADNPLTPAKVELGRQLFYDTRLSGDGTVACASCHSPQLAFSDAPNQVSRGVNGARGQRNSPTIVNAAYRTSFFWDGRASTLEQQAMVAFLSSVEMDADTVAVATVIRSAAYARPWQSAFGDTAVTMHRVMQAIASFERTIVSANSRYDQYVLGNTSALTSQEREGMNLFFSNKTMCGSCHGGQDFTNDQFQNIGLFSHYFDRGRYNVTKDPKDEGLFKTPTLRNIALTPPYMASGDAEKGPMNTLEQVVDHYNDGGLPFPNRDKRVKKLNLTDAEKAALVAFMKSLTDSSALRNPQWQKP